MMPETNDPWEALAAPSTRTPRSLETREHSGRKRSWAPPSILPDPDPQDGYVFKWVRTGGRAVGPDIAYFNKKQREGWEPVNIADHPELIAGLNLEIDQTHGRVEIGGLILCKMPQEMVEQRTAHYAGITRDLQTSAEEHYMRDSHELMQKVNESKRKVVFGRSR